MHRRIRFPVHAGAQERREKPSKGLQPKSILFLLNVEPLLPNGAL